MTLITGPWFYVFACPAVIFLGLSKGGFSGIGMVATPLLALVMPPLEAAAILLPIILLLAAFTSTLIQIGAPPYYAFVLPQRLAKMLYVGTTVWFFAAVNVMKVAPYVGLGQFSTAGLVTSAALIPLAIASNYFGVWLVRVTPEALSIGSVTCWCSCLAWN